MKTHKRMVSNTPLTVCEGFWHSGMSRWVPFYSQIIAPTHWQPLPNPPDALKDRP